MIYTVKIFYFQRVGAEVKLLQHLVLTYTNTPGDQRLQISVIELSTYFHYEVTN